MKRQEQIDTECATANQRLTLKLMWAVVAMFGFGFALVPLYDVMCDALGINGKTNSEAVVQPASMQVDRSRLIRVELMAHISPDMPWVFEPTQAVIEVHPGEVIETTYTAKNLSQSALVGQAVPSVSPGLGASYFNKIECFCFNQQPLNGGESVNMPVVFYIEPDLPDSIHTLSLSYTLFRLDSQKAKPEPTQETPLQAKL